MGSWQHFHHQADIGVRGIGHTIDEAFAEAAVALSAVITEPDKIHPDESLTIECNAPDAELLLVDWLNALVFEMATRRMLFSRFELEISNNQSLAATVWGEHVDPERHQPAVEVKGATYTALSVLRRDAGDRDDGDWVAQCVVDV